MNDKIFTFTDLGMCNVSTVMYHYTYNTMAIDDGQSAIPSSTICYACLQFQILLIQCHAIQHQTLLLATSDSLNIAYIMLYFNWRVKLSSSGTKPTDNTARLCNSKHRTYLHCRGIRDCLHSNLTRQTIHRTGIEVSFNWYWFCGQVI